MTASEKAGKPRHAGQFKPGQSGDPGGRPRGSKTIIYAVRDIVAAAIKEADSLGKVAEKDAIDRVRDNLRSKKTVLQTLELAARLNKEIGLGAGESVAGVTIIFESNIRPRAPRK